MYSTPINSNKRHLINSSNNNNSFTSIQETNDSMTSINMNIPIDRNHNGHSTWTMPIERGPEPLNNYLIAQPAVPVPQNNSNDDDDYDESRHSKRPVIPSKRAAQNRAAQKAFRQRREQYIKDLEIKSKQMNDWQQELNTLRKENGDLRDKIVQLEKQVDVLGGELHNKEGVGESSFIATKRKRTPLPPPLITTATTVRSQIQQERSMSLPTISSSYNPSSSSSSSSPSSSTTVTNTTLIQDTYPLRNHSNRNMINSSNNNSQRSYSSESRSKAQTYSREKNNGYQQQHRLQPQERVLKRGAEENNGPVFSRVPTTTGFNNQLYDISDHTNSSTTINNHHHTNNPNKRRKLKTQSEPMTGQVPVPTETTGQVNHIIIPSHRQQQQQQQQQVEANWNFNAIPNRVNQNDFEFDPFFEEEYGQTITNEFVPNGGQVLDDLFAMLQTRQRPQIPMMPKDESKKTG